ncbi:7560_t:CDS:10, partial [Diversispora eburnea]
MDPEKFVNLLLDRIETKANFPSYYSNFHLYLKPWSFNSYYDVLFAYILSDKIAPNGDLMFNGTFLTHLLIKRLGNSINHKAYTPILRFFNELEPQSNIFPLRPCILMLIIQIFHESRVFGHIMQWILSFISEEATWLLLQEDNQENDSSKSENISSFLSEQFSKLSRTLMYDNLELSKIIEGFSKFTNIKWKIRFTEEEIIVDLKFRGCQNILEYIIIHPSEHRSLVNEIRKLLEPDDFINFRPIFILFKIYHFEFPHQIEPLINQLRISQLLTYKEIKLMAMDSFLEKLIHNDITVIYLDHLEVLKLELKKCLELKQLIEIAELVVNVPFRFMTRILLALTFIHQFCIKSINNSSK